MWLDDALDYLLHDSLAYMCANRIIRNEGARLVDVVGGEGEKGAYECNTWTIYDHLVPSRLGERGRARSDDGKGVITNRKTYKKHFWRREETTFHLLGLQRTVPMMHPL